jgi:hypothetical protein
MFVSFYMIRQGSLQTSQRNPAQRDTLGGVLAREQAILEDLEWGN